MEGGVIFSFRLMQIIAELSFILPPLFPTKVRNISEGGGGVITNRCKKYNSVWVWNKKGWKAAFLTIQWNRLFSYVRCNKPLRGGSLNYKLDLLSNIYIVFFYTYRTTNVTVINELKIFLPTHLPIAKYLHTYISGGGGGNCYNQQDALDVC